jgi:ATP-dependent DNA helicase RecG
MRPEILFSLFKPVTTIGGVGPRLGKLIESLTGPQLVDLLWHLPSGLVDRRFTPKVADAPEGRIATLVVEVEEHRPPRHPRLPYKVVCADATGEVILVFFHAKKDWLEKALPVGEVRAVSGTVERYQDAVQMTHPDRIVPLVELQSLAVIEPVYPLTAGLPARTLAKAIRAALDATRALPEWIDAAYLKARGWPSWQDAVKSAHGPEGQDDLLSSSLPRQRLAYDELLANQLALALVRSVGRRQRGRSLKGDGRLRKAVLGALPFALTAGQRAALADVERDMASDMRLQRLLQGDVGSGKTLVAFLALLIAVEAGTQGAFMAPTDLLARQHHGTLEPLASAAGVRLALLTGRVKGAAREKILSALASGEVDILIGTHALFQDDVEFRDLAMAVIDEQHRFGVHQRVALSAKADRDKGGLDVLVMTATPIPRTLLLTSYGDMDVSRLTEKPAGRQPIDTRTLPLERLEEVVAAIGRAVDAGRRVYWLCPLVAESEVVDLAAAEARHAALGEIFGEKVGLVHGRMKGAARDGAMQDFIDGKSRVLVATTVIEVGVDVPEATIMVIEHAERFGLAQLHQLRGRVGRGRERSSCLLLYASPLGETAKKRLATLRETDDGFVIAEEDLKLRGPGELLGTRQSGLPDFKLADLAVHGELLIAARDQAKLAVERDPELKGPSAQALKTLLYLFRRDEGVKLLRSG